MCNLPSVAHGTPFCVVMTATATEEEARSLASQIVQQKLGACVQVQQVRSFYIWQGRPNDEPEWQLVIKTRRDRYQELQAFILARHSYDTPEIVQLPIEAGSVAYLAWLSEGAAPASR